MVKRCLVVGFAALSLFAFGCGSDKKDEKPADKPAAEKPAAEKPAAEKPAAEKPAAAPCKAGETKCDGEYTGKVKEGNNPPAGANAMECKDGVWVVKQACDAAKNEGCYFMDDPGTGDMNALCIDAMSDGE